MSDDIIDQMRQDIKDEFETTGRVRPAICATASFFLATSAASLLAALVATILALAFFSEEITQLAGRYAYTLIFSAGAIILISSGITGEIHEFKKRFRMGNNK